MAKVTRKTFLTTVDGTPKKRLFLSIISDYDLQTGLCELVDNAIDHWLSNGKQSGFKVEIKISAVMKITTVTTRISDQCRGWSR